MKRTILRYYRKHLSFNKFLNFLFFKNLRMLILLFCKFYEYILKELCPTRNVLTPEWPKDGKIKNKKNDVKLEDNKLIKDSWAVEEHMKLESACLETKHVLQQQQVASSKAWTS